MQGNGLVNFWLIHELYIACWISAVHMGIEGVSLVVFDDFKGVVHIPF